MEDLLLGFEETEPPRMPIHRIVVTRIVYDQPGDDFGIDPSELEYEIDHGACQARGEECIVEGIVGDLGLHAALFGVWDRGEGENRIQERVYRVRGWVSKTPATPNGPEEWDAGIELVDEDEECDGG